MEGKFRSNKQPKILIYSIGSFPGHVYLHRFAERLPLKKITVEDLNIKSKYVLPALSSNVNATGVKSRYTVFKHAL